MDEKQAPPAYSEATAPSTGAYNAGYAPPPGDQGAPPTAYPNQYGGQGYPQYGQPQQGGYNPQYGQPQFGAQYGGNYSQNSTVVVNQPMGAQGMVINNVPDHMGLAIFTTICCCWPLGLIAIMRAQESRRALDRGDVVSASTYSTEARRYSMWAIAGGCISVVIAIIIIVVVVTQNTYYYSTYG